MQHKRKLSVFLLAAFLFTMIFPVSAFAATFSDVPSNHWAVQQIDRMNARGIIVGYEDGTNRPNNPVTQFEALTMATRMMGLVYDENTHKGTYVPFKYPDWTGAYSVAVLGQEAGLVDSSDFNHSAAASREWIAKLLIKAMKVEDELSSVANETLAFSDADTIGSNYLNYVKLAYDKGLIGGYTDGTFKPKNTVTRAEMAAFLFRLEDKLNADSENVVRGTVSAINGVNVTIAGTDGKAYSLYATTNSVLYSQTSQKIGVTDLKVGDSVYVVYKNSLLTYLEVRSDIPTQTNLSGTISSVLAAKQIIVVNDKNGDLQTVVVDKNTKINKENSSVALAFEDLLTGMQVAVSVDKDSQTAKQIIIEQNASGQRSGTIHSIDVYDNVIVMDEKTGLVSYRLSQNIQVSISGMLTATASSLKEGDQATYTVSDGVMTAIAVGGNIDTYGGNATVKTIDTTNRIITYLTTSNELKAAYYNSGQTVKFNNNESGTVSDLQSGDSVNISVENNQVVSITVTSRSLSEGAVKGTLYAVNSGAGYIIITTSSGSRVTYDLASHVKVILYGVSSSLGNLEQGMKVELTLQNDKVTRIRANDLIEGVVKSVNSSTNTIQVTTENGTESYDVASNVTVRFYGKVSYRLSSVSVGDTVSMKLSNDEVTEIKVNEQVDMTIYSVQNSSGWLRLQDSDGDIVIAYLDETEFYIDEVHTTNLNEFTVGDNVIVTFAGSTIVKVEGVSQVKGEVTSVNTMNNTLAVKTSSNVTKTVTFSNSSSVVKNGISYNNLSTIQVGNRIVVSSSSSSGKTITVLNSRTGTVRYATSGLIQFLDDENGDSYKLINGCYCHYKNSTSQFTADTLTRNDSVTIYYVDKNSVYEVVKN